MRSITLLLYKSMEGTFEEVKQITLSDVLCKLIYLLLSSFELRVNYIVNKIV